MLIKMLQQGKDISHQQTRNKSLKATTHANYIDCIYLTDCPYNCPHLLDNVLDSFEDLLDSNLAEIHYTADTEQQRWSIKFRYDGNINEHGTSATVKLNNKVSNCYIYDTYFGELIEVEEFVDYESEGFI